MEETMKMMQHFHKYLPLTLLRRGREEGREEGGKRGGKREEKGRWREEKGRWREEKGRRERGSRGAERGEEARNMECCLHFIHPMLTCFRQASTAAKALL